MKIIKYGKSEFTGGDGVPPYTLYWFYHFKRYGGEWCWLWDENKLTLDQALKLYPPSLYEWQEITEN